MASVNGLERECLARICRLLGERLAERLVEVRMFGSAARGDMWPAYSPMQRLTDAMRPA